MAYNILEKIINWVFTKTSFFFLLKSNIALYLLYFCNSKVKKMMFTHSILKQKNVDTAEGTGNLIYKENSIQNDPCIKVRADAHLQGHAAITVQSRSAFEDILLQVHLLP